MTIIKQTKEAIDKFFDEWEAPSQKVYSKDLAEYLNFMGLLKKENI